MKGLIFKCHTNNFRTTKQKTIVILYFYILSYLNLHVVNITIPSITKDKYLYPTFSFIYCLKPGLHWKRIITTSLQSSWCIWLKLWRCIFSVKFVACTLHLAWANYAVSSKLGFWGLTCKYPGFRKLSEYIRMRSNIIHKMQFQKTYREIFSDLRNRQLHQWLWGYTYLRLYSKAKWRWRDEGDSDEDPFTDLEYAIGFGIFQWTRGRVVEVRATCTKFNLS